MVNRNRKGASKELRARKELIADGWRIIFQSVRTRFGAFDLADLFDILAIKGHERRYISVKHLGNNNYYLPHQAQIKEFAKEHGLFGEVFELWLWVEPRWVGRGKEKKFTKAHFKKELIVWVAPT